MEIFGIKQLKLSMAASFIKKDDGNFYLRLSGSTTSVKFGAISEAQNTYSISIARPGSTITIQKNQADNGNIYYTSSITEQPPGAILNNSRFPGSETSYNFTGAGTIREYLLSKSSTASFYLGGASLKWDTTTLYAYPGSGYLTNVFGIGIKNNGVWKNAGTIYIKNNGIWNECKKIYIKSGGVWKQALENYGNSSWINLLDSTDDNLDFALKVVAQN